MNTEGHGTYIPLFQVLPNCSHVPSTKTKGECSISDHISFHLLGRWIFSNHHPICLEDPEDNLHHRTIVLMCSVHAYMLITICMPHNLRHGHYPTLNALSVDCQHCGLLFGNIMTSLLMLAEDPLVHLKPVPCVIHIQPLPLVAWIGIQLLPVPNSMGKWFTPFPA